MASRMSKHVAFKPNGHGHGGGNLVFEFRVSLVQSHLVRNDAIRLLILLSMLTSSGDEGNKYWSIMRTKASCCSSGSPHTWKFQIETTTGQMYDWFSTEGLSLLQLCALSRERAGPMLIIPALGFSYPISEFYGVHDEVPALLAQMCLAEGAELLAHLSILGRRERYHTVC